MTQKSDIMVAVTSAVTHSPQRVALREGHRYRADSLEVQTFPDRVVRDGASSAEIGAVRSALWAKKAGASRHRNAPRPVAAGAASANMIAIARRKFTAVGRTITRGQRFPATDPIVAAFMSEFDLEAADRP